MADGDPHSQGCNGASAHQEERRRLIAALWRVASESGYRRVTVEGILRFGGLPEERFEVHFNSLDDALEAAQDRYLQQLSVEVRESCRAGGLEWPEQVRAGLTSAISDVIDATSLARAFAIEATGMSAAAAVRHFELLDEFASMLAQGRRLYARAAVLPAITERTLVGGVAGIFTQAILDDDAKRLLKIQPQLLELLLTPFLGSSQAHAIATRE